MNIIELPLTILFFSILSVPLAVRLRIPLEIFLLITSALISLWPSLPIIEIKPYVVFYFFLPPILFSAAYFTSWNDFKLNIRPISYLALGLVIVTACVIACFAKFFLPDFTWAEGFLLGAIVSPTDASAATTLIKKLGAPRRLISILEGESLINDASALLIFQFSLIAIMTGSFSLVEATKDFFIMSIGGMLIGLVLGYIGVLILKRLHDVQAETTLTFIVAFACYVVADRFHFSGVMATVAGGIYFGLMLPIFSQSRTRMAARASWGTLLFIINVTVFALIGLELSWVIRNLGKADILTLLFYGIMLSILIIAVRMLWVFIISYLPRKFLRNINTSPPTPSMLFIIGWSGMRGIVSLAAVLAVPTTLGSVTFPHRSELIFLIYCVIVITLILPALTLPHLIRIFGLDNSGEELHEEAMARLQTLKNVMIEIAKVTRAQKITSEVYDDFLKHVESRVHVIETQSNQNPYSTLPSDFFMMRKLILAAIETERATLIQLRKEGKIQDDVFRKLSDELDVEEIRAYTLRI